MRGSILVQGRLLRVWEYLWGGSGGGLPLAVTNYLLPHEKRAIAVHLHPGVYASHASLLACSCVAASLITANTSSGIFVLSIAWGVCGIILFWLIIRAAAWFGTFFVVTEIRLIFISGLVVPKVITVPLREIRDLELRRSLFGRLIGYGVFIAEPSKHGYKIPKMNYIPYPEQLFLETYGMLFPEGTEDSHQREPEELA